MEEQKLNFKVNEDPTIVVVSEDIEKKAIKACTDFNFVAHVFLSHLKNKRLTEGEKETYLSLSESHIRAFVSLFDYDSVLKKQAEERYSEIRITNEQNRELRKQLGGKVSNEDLRERLKIIKDEFYKWWSIYGFGHCSDGVFNGYMFETKLSGYVYGSHYDERESEKEKVEMLRGHGFEIDDSDGCSVISSDNNIRLLKNLLEGKYASVKIGEIKSTYYNNRNQIRDIKISISDFNDFD